MGKMWRTSLIWSLKGTEYLLAKVSGGILAEVGSSNTFSESLSVIVVIYLIIILLNNKEHIYIYTHTFMYTHSHVCIYAYKMHIYLFLYDIHIIQKIAFIFHDKTLDKYHKCTCYRWCYGRDCYGLPKFFPSLSSIVMAICWPYIHQTKEYFPVSLAAECGHMVKFWPMW